MVLEDFTKKLPKTLDIDDSGVASVPEITIGQQYKFSDVMMLGTNDFTLLGRPLLNNVAVWATIEEVTRTDKVIIFKKKRRKGYQKSQGHK